MNDGTDFLTAAVAFAAVGTSVFLFPALLTVVVVAVTVGFFGYRWWARRHRSWIAEHPQKPLVEQEQAAGEADHGA